MFAEIFEVLELTAFGLLAIFLVAGEYLDWFGRLEALETKYPKIHRLALARPLRLVLLLLIFVMLAENTKELIKNLEDTRTPPTMKFNMVVAPNVCETIPRFNEPENSLRRRTMKLVHDLTLFWSQRPLPPQQPVPTPSSDAERARNAAWDHYWQDVTAAYESKDFKARILGIVREYKAKGIPTGFLEQSAEQPNRLIGAVPYGGYALDNCERYENEVCQIRELVFHVDGEDKRIDPPDF